MAVARPMRVQRGPETAAGLGKWAFTLRRGRTTGTSIRVGAIDPGSLYQPRDGHSLGGITFVSAAVPPRLAEEPRRQKKAPARHGPRGSRSHQDGHPANSQRIETWASAEAVRWAGSRLTSTDFPATRSMVFETTCSLPSTTVATLIS